MLSIGKVVDAGYYFSRVADTVEHYYSLQGEAAGYWLGGGAAELGVSGTADAEQFQRVGRPASGHR